jgi:large repetitive protein
MRVHAIKFVHIISVTILIALFGQNIGLFQVCTASADTMSSINISIPEDVAEGGAFTARINITEGATFNSYQIQLSYNPNVIQVMSIEGDTEGVTQGIVGSTIIPVDMWSFFPSGIRGDTIRILGRIPSNQSVKGSGYLAEVHFTVVGSAGKNSNLTPTETVIFANGLFDSDGNKIGTYAPWGGALVNIYAPLQISTSNLTSGSIENNYSLNLKASGGNIPYTWNGTGLPGGLSISGNGTIIGKPTQSGDFNIHISLADSSNPIASAQKDFMMHVYPGLQIVTESLPEGTQGKNYTIKINTTAAAEPIIWSATGLPSGIIITNSGVLSGTSLVSGDYNISVMVTDSFNPPHSITKNLSLHIYSNLVIATESLPDGLEKNDYIYSLSAGGGKVPYFWTANGLPSGLSLGSYGGIFGTPASAGDYNITAYVNDSFDPSNNASRAFSLHISQKLQVVTTELPESVVGKSVETVLIASGGIPPYNWSVSGLPSGLTCSSAGNISGIPEASGNYVVNLILKDSYSPANTINTSFNLHVYDALIITVSQLTGGVIGKSYSGFLTASGGQDPYIWNVNGLPSGLQFSTSGAISGAPKEAGNFILNVMVSDSLSISNNTAGTVRLKIYLIGDADGSGYVNMGDVTYVERVILGLVEETSGCDANLNGSISIGDVTMIERIILGLS